MTSPSLNRHLALLTESARLYVEAGLPPVDEAAAREERLCGLSLVTHMHAWCAPEEPAIAVAAWEGPLARFGTPELLDLLDIAVAEALEANREQRPFHLTALLSALLMDWTHRALLEMETDGRGQAPRAGSLRDIFESSSALLASLAQEADARCAANLVDIQLRLAVAA